MKTLLLLIIGSVMGFSIHQLFTPPTSSLKQTEKQPLYWVAPMDANYRRDKPGLSPMGMELIPVYKDGGADEADSAGTIRISPAVINNLGVRISTARMMPFNHDIKTVGLVQYDEDKMIHIHPRVAGWIEKSHIKASGDPVKKGQPLYDLYSPELVNAQQEYIAEVKRNNGVLIAAAEERLRALQISEHTIKQLRKTLKIKQTVTFYAPQSGVVDNLNIRSGFYVQPSTTMMSIGVLDQVWVEAEIFESQAHFLKLNQKVSMKLDFLPEKTWFGKVDYIYPSLDPQNRTLRARLKFDNKDLLLKPNMFSQVLIHNDHPVEKLVVPTEAVIRTGEQDRLVLALGDGKFKSIAIKIGAISDDYIEILKGISAGEKIVSSAHFLLDSESSKKSDFKRMSHPLIDNPELPTAKVSGTVNTIDQHNQTINISRGAIEKWGRAAATLDFSLASGLSINNIKPHDKIDFTFVINNGDFVITEFKAAMKQDANPTGMNHDSMIDKNVEPAK